MLTIKQLYNKTPRQRKESARYVKLLKKRQGYDKDGYAFIAAQTQSTHILVHGKPVRVTNPSTYVTVIKFIDHKLHAKVSCSCMDNMYRYEYTNTNKGASDIEYSNGEPSDTSNPNQVPGLCKHLVRLYEHIEAKLP